MSKMVLKFELYLFQYKIFKKKYQIPPLLPPLLPPLFPPLLPAVFPPLSSPLLFSTSSNKNKNLYTAPMIIMMLTIFKDTTHTLLLLFLLRRLPPLPLPPPPPLLLLLLSRFRYWLHSLELWTPSFVSQIFVENYIQNLTRKFHWY